VPDLVLAKNTQAVPSPPVEPPAKPAKALSESEKIKALPDDERKWLTEFAAPIILPEEQKVFLELSEPYQWEQFKQAFWERREQSSLQAPLGPGYRYRYQELRQLADEKYDGWRNDAGRMVLRWGEPAEILQPKCDETFRDLEVWIYTNMGNSGRTSARYIFYGPQRGGLPTQLLPQELRRPRQRLPPDSG
jgi:GWxTD domain-containing protein